MRGYTFPRNSRSLVFPPYIYASSGMVRAFDTHTAYVHAYTRTTIIFSSIVESLQQARAVDSLLSEIYVRAHVDVDSVCVCCNTHTGMVDASRQVSIESSLLQQMPVATRPERRYHVFGSSASRTSACLCLRRSSFPSVLPPFLPPPPAVTHEETFFALFAT